MSLSRRQRRLLQEMSDAVSRSDPLLARKLAVFSQLSAGQPMPRREQLRTLASRIRAALLPAATRPAAGRRLPAATGPGGHASARR